MIKNVIFDLGRALINFDPEAYLEELRLDKETRKIYLDDIFKGHEWLDLDRGIITEEQAIKKIVAKGRLKEGAVRKILDARISFFTELSLNIPLVKKIKDNGYKLYILSNFPKIPFEAIFKKYEFFRNFDGGVVSYEEGVNVIKPDSKIYDILLSRYNLLPQETIFIDDTLVNIEKAEEYGITGIHLPDHTELRKKLIEKGLI
ncbi:HAD family phosphatase [Psychrilyobacter sp.]|uniref:HAD family hydrolase n=1 Tax=Psychrilyobacter sp. TaxID=2586924 RepID=UPI00301A10D6